MEDQLKLIAISKKPIKIVVLENEGIPESMGMFFLGRCYESGKGVPKDINKAAELFQAAYERGYEGWKDYFKNFLEHHPGLKNPFKMAETASPILTQFEAQRLRNGVQKCLQGVNLGSGKAAGIKRKYP